MKKMFYSVLCLAASFMLGNTAVIAAPVSALASETVTAETAQINDISQICDMFTRFIEENKLDAKCVSDEAYPQYAGTVVVEFNTATSANRAILEYAERNNIARTAFNLVPCTNGSPITTVLPGGEGLTTVTTTVEGITNIDQIREMFTKYITDNELDAKCVSDETYPQYAGTVVVEFNSDTSANRAILEYAEKNNIARTAFNLVPCKNGIPITTVLPDGESLTTVTTTVEGITNSVETNLSYFFELSLDEIEERLNADTTQRDTGSVSIALSISKAQIQKQLADLEPQKEAIEAWQISFKKAYFDLLLEKLHLTGIYDAADPEYLNTDLPSAWIDETDPFTIVESDHDESALCWVKLGYGKDVLLEYNNETITMTPYEAAERSLYVIRTYGDKDYYTSARDDLKGKYIGTDIAGVAGDANCDGFCDVSDAVLIARFVNADREAVFTDKGKLNADVMFDGNVDMQDAERILQYIAKKISYEEFSADFDPYMVPIDYSVNGLGAPEMP